MICEQALIGSYGQNRENIINIVNFHDYVNKTVKNLAWIMKSLAKPRIILVANGLILFVICQIMKVKK
ncbi:MAG: hypothetical protein UT50_C0004G0029 [Candidatus Moranbacteria bacterium GW2011_GWA2_39_41]|nr:MAG: hypothetical protein UT50_C0004G0029 [Candidatus Moranbacteria bacterium GW2011_GWA2_39_41]